MIYNKFDARECSISEYSLLCYNISYHNMFLCIIHNSEYPFLYQPHWDIQRGNILVGQIKIIIIESDLEVEIMDKIDKKILSLLQENARYPLKHLAQKVFLSSPAVSTRIERMEKAGIITASGISLDESAHTASFGQQEIALTPREFELLSFLMRNAGNVVSREDLLAEAWGWDYLTTTKTVDTHIKRLRDKLSSVGLSPSVIETVRGYGYRFVKNFVNPA